MAILKMKAVTLVGQIHDFERVVSKYVDRRDIHLENAMTVLEDTDKLTPYEEDNQYAALIKNISDILKLAGYEPKEGIVLGRDMSREEMFSLVNKINHRIEQKKQEKLDLEKQIKENDLVLKQLDTMINFDVDLPSLFKLEFIDFRFGRISKGSYKTLVTYLGDIEAVFMQTGEDENDVWGFYFVPHETAHKIDAVFASLYFERVRISDKVIGTPKESRQALMKENQQCLEKMKTVEAEIKDLVQTSYLELSDMYWIGTRRQRLLDVRKYAAHSSEFFYIIGWMPEKSAKQLEKEISAEDSVIFFDEEPEKVEDVVSPPTKLKNISIFRPFEMFVKMYGLPSYKEVDPTPILAITYILLFGIMFGDVGQSAVFAIAGFILYRIKKWDLAAMISMVGVSGTVFGFLYGSVFGNETVLEHVRVLAPMEQINFMLISAVALGVFIIVFCMVMNIINAVKMNQWGRVLFSQNGIAGLTFYLTLILLVVGMLFGFHMPVLIMIVILAVTFLAMYLQEPLTGLIEGKKDWLPKQAIFYVQSFFEMFDILLSFVTNTISFLRVGAFAIIHVGMMLAVAILAGDGAGAVFVKIIGNLVVMGLEGLIVGIQVLRLEYYEMFSRYFDGNGKAFNSLKN